MRYTDTPPWYLEPPTSRIQRLAAREGLGELSAEEVEFVLDFCAREVGAEVRPFDGRNLASAAADYAKDKLRILRGSQFFDPGEDAYASFTHFHTYSHEYIDFRRSIHRVLAEFDLRQIPGRDLVQRVVRLLGLLRAMEQQNKNDHYSPHADAWDSLKQAVERVSEQQDDPRVVQLLENPRLHADEAADQAVMLLLHLALQEVNVTEMLRVARHLDGISELLAPRASAHPDLDGEDVTTRPIGDLSEIPRASQGNLVLPRRVLLYRAVTGALPVSEPVTHRDRRQLLYLLVDGSGSMLERLTEGGDAAAAGRAAGVVLNRLRGVMDGDAEVYLRFFDGKLREEEYHADSPETAQRLIEVVTNPFNYTGGSTNFLDPLRDTSRRVHQLVEMGDLRDPEIFLVTDGQANVPALDVLRGVRLHTLQVGGYRVGELGQLAEASGGIDLFLASNNR